MTTQEKVNKVIELKAAIAEADKKALSLELVAEKVEETYTYSHFTDHARRLGIAPDDLRKFIHAGIDQESTFIKTHILGLYQLLEEMFR